MNVDDRWRRIGMWRWTVWVLVLLVSGCSCWSRSANTGPKPKAGETQEEMEARLAKEAREKLEKDEKPDFELVRMNILPGGETGIRNLVKPGHWFAAVQTSKANNFDLLKADLEARCVDTSGRSIGLSGTNYEFSVTRPVSLPKGQAKHLDLLLFANAIGRGIRFQTQLRPRGGGRVLLAHTEPALRMSPFQNYMVVLSERPENYQFVKSMRSVRLKREQERQMTNSNLEWDYFVKLPTGYRRVDLPAHPLTWTNIAYVIWDDFDPEILSLDQQRAMLDWLHWGGQVIINGPRTLDRLAGSVFAPYLPARPGEVGKLTQEAMQELDTHWSYANGLPIVLRGKEPPLTLELELADGASFVAGTAELVAQRDVGRGRMVVSAFNLPHEVFVRWDSWDTFFNACLLGRPPRNFRSNLGFLGSIVDEWAVPNLKISRNDSRLTSQLRYFTRDAMRLTNPRTESGVQATNTVSPLRTRPAQDPYGRLGFADDPLVGVAGWNDDSDASSIARRALRTSAGISVPSIDFIAKTLGLYLLALVPINWLVFRVIGRVEWAWAAVPLIAICGALAVVKIAQLDIGFARSRTEVTVVETQPGYRRAHVSRYVGLYSSLTSRYEVLGEDDSTLIQPLASEDLNDNGGSVALYQGPKVRLSGFNVLSNSTGMLHGEQMLELGGAIEMLDQAGSTVISNQSDHNLKGVVAVRRTPADVIETVWLGDLDAKSTKDVTFEQFVLDDVLVEYKAWENSTATSREAAEGELNIRNLLDLALDPARLGLGETVMVGWNDQLLAGLTVQPAASQVTARTVFVCQLTHAVRPKPVKDMNSYAVLLRKTGIDQEIDEEEFEF